jgi:hypothetical protein
MLQIGQLTRPHQDTFRRYRDNGVIALSIDALTEGTAGGYCPEKFDLETVRNHRGPVPYKVRVKELASVAPSTAQLLTNIRDTFALKMSEVAQIFGVSRRAAYDWLEGATPKPELIGRIYQLSTLTARFKDAGIPDVRQFIHRPIVGERTLFELLKSGDNLDRAIEVIRVTALEEASARKPLGRRVKDASDLDEESTPIFG